MRWERGYRCGGVVGRVEVRRVCCGRSTVMEGEGEGGGVRDWRECAGGCGRSGVGRYVTALVSIPCAVKPERPSAKGGQRVEGLWVREEVDSVGNRGRPPSRFEEASPEPGELTAL